MSNLKSLVYSNVSERLNGNNASLLFDFINIKSAKTQTLERDGKRVENSRELYKEALKHIYNYKQHQNKEELEQASVKLFKCLSINRQMVEPYVWIAYIYHSLNMDDKAFKYLKLAEMFNPAFPQIQKLKNLILQKSSVVVEEKLVELSNLKMQDSSISEDFKSTVKSGVISENIENNKKINAMIKSNSDIKVTANSFVRKIVKNAYFPGSIS